MVKWYIDKGPQSDVVVSSRARLARNLKGFPFPFIMNREQSFEVVNKVYETLIKREKSCCDFQFIDIEKIDEVSRHVMVEKRLISPNLGENRVRSAVIISRDEKVSIMVNEEDHLRIQCMLPGMQIEEAWKMCDRIDTLIESRMEYAFDEELGYLTCCPTNLGTGMRVSAMMHLPALTMTGYVKSIFEACSKLGLTVRGIYGERSEASGNMFQVSNQVTLGHDEKEIITSMNNIILQIIEQERSVRKQLYESNKVDFEDKIYRSLGILENARIISLSESIKLLSDVRLGINMGIVHGIDIETINEITISIQPANLENTYGRNMPPELKDIKRAEVIRNRICRRM